MLGYGMGRKAKLNNSISLDMAVQLVKKHLKLNHVRLAKSPGEFTAFHIISLLYPGFTKRSAGYIGFTQVVLSNYVTVSSLN